MIEESHSISQEPCDGRPVEMLFTAQKAMSDERRMRFGLAERRAALARLAAAIRKFEGEIVQAMATDFGKPEAEVFLTEILPVMQDIRHSRRNLRRWMRPVHVGPTLIGFGTAGRIVPQPRGVCLIIAPWNYPFNLCLGPLVSCLAAGNSAILKPSEMTPATSGVIARLIADTFPPDLVTVALGGKEMSQALLALPFDHIFFTGSPEVGKVVMQAASRHLTSVTLELGGKSPTIVGPDADIETAASWIAFGKFSNAGQTCIAPDHVFVHASIRDRFVEALRRRIAAAYGSGMTSPYLARIVNDRHADRLGGLIADALADVGRGWIQTVGDFEDAIDAEFDLRREMAARSGLPLTMTLLQKEARPEEWRDLLGRIEEANAEGLRITAQIRGRPTSVLLGFELSINMVLSQ